jgi:heme-degrading monooxygenase HmoA
MAQEMEAGARAMPGFVDFKTFVAEDGEQVSVVNFGSPAAHRAWRDDPRAPACPTAGPGRLLSRVLRACRNVHPRLVLGRDRL